MWVATDDLPRTAAHPFYTRLNQILDEHHSDQYVEGLCQRATIRISIESDPALFRPHDAPLVLGDSTRLTRDTGWAPEIPLDRTLDDLLAYWRRAIDTEHDPSRP